MLSLRNLHAFLSPYTSVSQPPLFSKRLAVHIDVAISMRSPCCSLRVEELSRKEPLESSSVIGDVFRMTRNENVLVPKYQDEEEEDDDEEEDERGISKVQVSRQKYIPVSKAELLDAIVLKLLDHFQDDVEQFLHLSSCLDSILHAEHKRILEEMRTAYFPSHSVTNSGKKTESTEPDGNTVVNGDDINGMGSIGSFGEETVFDKARNFNYGVDLRTLLGSSGKFENMKSNGESRLAVDTRFQRSFMQLLNNAQFQELSATDLMLTSALNSDYLLTLPIYVDWKKASKSNAIIFRRGYATERQKGLLIVEKLDYLQSRLLQQIFFLVSKPLGKLGKWMKEAVQNASQTQELQDWIKKMMLWLEEFPRFQQLYSNKEQTSNNPLGMDQLSDSDLPIWLAAQRAVSRYEGFLSPVGPRGRLLRKLLTWIGVVPPVQETTFEPENENNTSEPRLRPTFLSRISLSDIWRPATRKYCGNDVWKMLKSSFSILLSQSVLQEPAFKELILLYTDEMTKSDKENKIQVPSLQLKIYERIPIPDLLVVFPHKKLSFRIIDTVRLDVATLLGLAAYFINYKFENILSNPSAIFLDVIAVTALIIYVTRVALGYKQTWDRYQLLVNKTLYEKTLASGFGSVHFLLDASEQQQYKEAILMYSILLRKKNSQVICRRSTGDECERFMYDVFKVKVEMPVNEAISTLLRLGLVRETTTDGRKSLQAIHCEKALEVLKERWNSLLG
ncbi:hypothetical protein K2173_005095 [Erythroxylum novogranatense]|uniref:Uncharacterized protein n=1 Tax=Erythroxylum novogranatense TaxID=1862640 RepID=A0AAV8UB70_9ROSI|nr:hypothetical protein K2173_005095 [Erythroxylum novogranatense]